MALSETPPPKKGPSLVMQIGVLTVVTAVAIGGGWLSGNYLNGKIAAPVPSASAEQDDPEKGGEALVAGPLSLTVVPLEGIVTNLAAPSDIWIRMEASIVLDEPRDETLAVLVHQDFLAYLRTVKLHQIEGASGLQHLKADLQERAAIRSEGHVKQVLIRTLLFE